jgi:hypothetical protein
MTNPIRIEEEIRRLGFDTLSAQKAAADGQIEAWVHAYLMAGTWANPGLSQGLKLQKRWWHGPVEVRLSDLARCVGPEPGMEYHVTMKYWDDRTRKFANSMTNPLAVPPLIVEYRGGELNVRDGNTRHGAMQRLGWPNCWVIIWYNQESAWLQHSALLLDEDEPRSP